ncbi:2-amino-3-ketobutyrate coenzyme A ligase, mitochondrial-like isoform X2 [Limulus polyphemus]|uniref:2-amino-3-ketobutyrate coenzyme A ligase, mitochondrial-like isoform X2 n=1 Tax=Limulus polyphemus TaxID=6850 RepID=A0ABM1BFI9_LIMPO|nr:2-amino-3-ketobutyrate coenzyme A ligase, mitochondrial-like isoform X2 [Limulus polyphemus]
MAYSHLTSFLGTISLRLTPSVSVWNSCYRSCNSSWAATKAILDQELKSIKNAGTWKEERIITSRQDALISVEGKTEKVLNFCANNYLGLSSHPAVVEAGKKALDKYGAGLSSVRFICGTQDLHKELERKVAKFHGREEAILYASCFDANAGLFEVLLTPEDAVISDELNHASIIDGIRLCKAQKIRYQHRNMKELEEKLEESQGARLRLIATDGVFSMDGNVTPLRNICDLAEKYKAMVFVDECHATGFFGRTGRGTEEYFNLTGRVDIINSTLGKALGGAAGGYTTGKKEVIELLRQRSRPYLFSNTLPPPVVACASKVFDILMDSSTLTDKVKKNTQKFRTEMKAAGFNVIGDDHPICPVMLGDARLASVFAEEMLERGIYVIGFSFPVVPKGKARIRVQISAAHSEQDIDKTVDAFLDVGKKLKVI